jgi:anaerobic selenocysteine-containing dehydrogenase
MKWSQSLQASGQCSRLAGWHGGHSSRMNAARRQVFPRFDVKPGADLIALQPRFEPRRRLPQVRGTGYESAGTSECSSASRRHLRSSNSWRHNVPSLMKGRDRCILLMHTADSQRRVLSTGDVVEVVSPTGKLQAPVEVIDAINPVWCRCHTAGDTASRAPDVCCQRRTRCQHQRAVSADVPR